MNAAFENDATKGPGHGFIRLGGLDAIPGAPAFSLQRAGDHLFLGVAGWQEAEEQLVPVAVDTGGDTLSLSVSPGVVDQLDPLETYRITLHGNASPVRATLRVEHVVLSPLAGSGSLHEAKKPTPPAPPAAPAPKPEPAPEPLPMPEPAPAPAGNKWILPVVLAALLLGGGAAGWWYWQGVQTEKAAAEKAETEKAAAEKAEADKLAAEKAEADKLAAEKAAAEKAEADKLAAEKLAAEKVAAEKAEAEKAEAEKLAAEKAAAEKAEAEKLAAEKATAEKAAAEKAAAEKPALSAKEQARVFLRGQGSAAEAFTLGSTLPSASAEDQDAVFLLMEMAAQGGNSEAMLTLARYYNPADASPSGSILKDPEQAALWLKKAAEKPETAQKARAAMADLKSWIEKSNDPAIQHLLKTLE